MRTSVTDKSAGSRIRIQAVLISQRENKTVLHNSRSFTVYSDDIEKVWDTIKKSIESI
jgi:hypothetical protein